MFSWNVPFSTRFIFEEALVNWISSLILPYVSAAASIPMGRVSYPEDYLGMAFFLAGEASAYITGQTFLVDGGWGVSRVFKYEND